MPHASKQDGTRCTGRGRWNWHSRANFCGKCGAMEPSRLPKFVPCKYKPMVQGGRCIFADGHKGPHDPRPANIAVIADRIRALHCIRCINVITGKPKADPCRCACHVAPDNKPGQPQPPGSRRP